MPLQFFLGASLAISDSSSDEYILTPSATSTVDHVVSALDTYILTPAASAVKGDSGVAADTYIFTPAASSGIVRHVSASDTYILTPAASVHTDFGVGTGGTGPTYIMTAGATSTIDHAVAVSSTYIFTPSDVSNQVVIVNADDTYIFTVTATSTAIRLVSVAGDGDGGPTYIFTPGARATIDWKVAASNTYIFTPSSLAAHVNKGVAPVTYIMEPRASHTTAFAGRASDTYIMMPQAVGHVINPHRTASDTYIMTPVATSIVVALVCTPLGRFRRGDVVPITLSLPYIPDQSPFAVVLDGDDQVVQAFQMNRSVSNPGNFVYDLFLGQDYLFGRYVIVFTVLAGSIPQTQVDQCFNVILGGDAGGPVISLVCYQRGKLQSVLAHLGSGELVLGKNPSLDLMPPSLLPSGWQVVG